MGSFNTTCFVSNQIIATHDKCRVIPISQQSTYQPVALTTGDKSFEMYGVAHSTCHPNSFWQPVGGLLPAEYADYGGFTLILDQVARANLMTFFGQVRRACPKVAAGENPYHDLPFDFEQFLANSAPGLLALMTPVEGRPIVALDSALDAELAACWEYIYGVAAEHRLFIRGSGGHMRPLQFAVMHERAYAALVASVASDKGWDGESFEQGAYLRRALAQAYNGADEYAKIALEVRAEAVLEAQKTGQDVGPEISGERIEKMRPWAFADSLRDSLRQLTDGNSYPAATCESAVLRQLSSRLLAGTLTDDEFVGKFRPLLDDRYAVSGLAALNLRFTPLVYAGQDYSNGTGQAYAKLVATVSKQVTRDRKVASYGEYLDYFMQVPTKAQLEAFEELARESDCELDDVGVIAVAREENEAPPLFNVTFSCPMDLGDLKELLTGLPDSELMMRTLTERDRS